MNTKPGDNFAHHARAVALELYGEPNRQLSTAAELRFGKQGSKSVDLAKGTFYDHQEGEGGGVLWAIERETGRKGREAVEWMRERGFDVEDTRPTPPPRTGGGPRLDPAGNWLPQRVPDHGRLTKSYDYRDASGRLAYQVCRYDWTVDASVNPKGREKTFVQRVPDTKKPGGWSYSTKGVTWLPYRLPELIEDVAQCFPVFLVEGEKKVDMLREIGVPATCNHGGAGKFPDDLAQWFKGAKVIVLPDNDDAGREHAGLIARRLEGVAASVMRLDIPGLPPKGGVDDWLPEGGSAEKLYDLVEEAARPLDAAPFVSAFQAVEWHEFDTPGVQHEHLIKGVLTRGEMSMLLGESQSGKSFLAIDLAMAVARGLDTWFGHRVRRGGVVYQAGESAAGVRRKRFPAYRIGHDVRDPVLPLVLLQGALDLYSSDDPTAAFIEECRHWGRRFSNIAPLELIVVDTFNKATPGANENDGKDMGMVLSRCDRIRRETGAHVMLVHHLNAGGTKARGHTSLFANVENVLTVTRVPDSHDSEGRPLRSWRIAKQKDGEDGKETRFVLRGVRIGADEDGDDVFSCVVAPPERGTGENAPEDCGLSVRGNNSVMLRAIYDAVAKRGVYAPPELGLGVGAMAVERKALWDVVRSAFDAGDDPTPKPGETEEDARRRRGDAIRQAAKRARDYLFSRGIIGHRDEWTWLTGKPVRGFEQAPGLPDLEREERARRRHRRADDTQDAGGAWDSAPDYDLPFDTGDFR
jgi:hypothetical protein